MDRVRLPLFLLRAGVFIVMLMWTLDKFIHPGHAAGVFKKFYSIGGISPARSMCACGLWKTSSATKIGEL